MAGKYRGFVEKPRYVKCLGVKAVEAVASEIVQAEEVP